MSAQRTYEIRIPHLVVVVEHVRPQQPLRLDIVRETSEEISEILVFSLRPHVIESLFGDVKILGVTQRTALSETRCG